MRSLPAALLAACAALAALLSPAAAPAKGKELHLYTWSDYVKPELIERFEKEQKCRVVIDTFDSNESMYAKLKAGATGYDVITPSSYMARIMDQQGLLRALDAKQLPNRANVDADYLKLTADREMRHSVPYMLTTTGIGHLTSKVKGFEPSWSVFDRADLKGRMTLLNDMRETIGAALKSLGYSLNSRSDAEIAKARDVVIRWKRNLAKFENEQYKSGLGSGEFHVVHGYSGDIFQAQAENEDIGFAVPREGTSIASDDLVIPKGAKDVALAHAFINFLHDPKVAAENSNFIAYLCPNKPSYAFLDPELRENPAVFLPPEIRAKCEVIEDLGPDNAKYTKAWDAIKAAK